MGHLKFEHTSLNTYLVGNEDNMYLGSIVWMSEWREFVFEPDDQTFYSAGCLKEIADYIIPLNRERKESIKNLKKRQKEREDFDG